MINNNALTINSITDSSFEFSVTTRGRVTCEPDFKIGPRTINDHLIYFIEKGEMAATINRKHIVIPKESVFWLQPGTEHSIRLTEKRNATVFFLRFFLGNNSTPVKLNFPYFITPPYPSLLPHFQSILSMNSPHGDFEKPYIRCHLGILFTKIMQESEIEQNYEKNGLRLHQRKKAIDFLKTNITTRFSIKKLADSCALNVDYFSRQFKKSFGISPAEWIKRERIRIACDYLLESGLSVSEIAHKLGYEELYFFSRQFKEITGKSPLKWAATR